MTDELAVSDEESVLLTGETGCRQCGTVPYEMRIETAYETQKDRLQMENSAGTKPVLLQQDIYGTIYSVCG